MNIEKQGSDFSLTKKLNDFIINYDWKEGINDVINNNLPTSNNKVSLKDCPSNSALWYTVSATFEQMGSDTFSKINNFVSNLHDPETCSIDALASMAQLLKIDDYKLFQTIYPLEIKEFIDTYSISRSKLLLSGYVLSDDYVTQVINNCNIGISGVMQGYVPSADIWTTSQSSDISYIQNNGTTKIDDDLYIQFLENQIYDLLITNITADGILDDFFNYIYVDDIYTSDNILATPDDTQDIIDLKKKNGVPLSFHVREECDKVIRGETRLHTYSKIERDIMEVEIQSRRELDKFGSNLTKSGGEFKRYRYEKERKVRDYIKFIETVNMMSDNISIISGNYYDEISGNPIYFFDKIEDVPVSGQMIDQTVQFIKNVCISTSYLRENIKTMIQKYETIGTGNSLKLCINEYILREFTNPESRRIEPFPALSSVDPITKLYVEGFFDTLSANLYNSIKVIEYFDNTEYYNISATNDSEALSGSLNDRYWEGISDENNKSTSEHSSSDINMFYSNLDNFRNISSDLVSAYINELYNYGALSAVLSSSLNDTIPSSILAWDDNASLSSMYLRYYGSPSGDLQFYNYKNIIHPSIAIVPYLWNLKQYEQNATSIEKIYNFVPMTSSELNSNVSSMYDEQGNIINVWKKDNITWNAYRDAYEYAPNFNKDYIEDERSDYDGPFYFHALSAYLDNTSQYIDNFDMWYSHLQLTDEEITKIKWQLVYHESDIRTLQNKVIYNFIIDKYGNQYTLYKESNSFDIPGTLWMKYKNHPISFPIAIADNLYSQVDANTYLYDFDLFINISQHCYDFGFTSLSDINTLWMYGGSIYDLIYTPTPQVGGSVITEPVQQVNYLDNGMQVTAVPEYGYEFNSWSDGNLNPVRKEYNLTGDIYLTALFETVGFDLIYLADNYGSILGDADQRVEYLDNGTTVTAYPDNGYEFLSWNDGYLNAIRQDLSITGDLTFSANFDPKAYNVLYNGNSNTGGTVPASQTSDYLTTITLRGNTGTLVKSGSPNNYTFTGWNTQTDGLGTHYDVSANFTIPASNTTLYAEWQIPVYEYEAGDFILPELPVYEYEAGDFILPELPVYEYEAGDWSSLP